LNWQWSERWLVAAHSAEIHLWREIDFIKNHSNSILVRWQVLCSYLLSGLPILSPLHLCRCIGRLILSVASRQVKSWTWITRETPSSKWQCRCTANFNRSSKFN
jgi:hypothetical protein